MVEAGAAKKAWAAKKPVEKKDVATIVGQFFKESLLGGVLARKQGS